MKAFIVTLIVLLLFPLTTFAASAQSGREFIVEEPFEKVLDAFSDPDGLKEMLKKWNAKIVKFQWEELEAEVDKKLLSKEKADWEAKLKFYTHIRISTPKMGLKNIHLRVTVFRSGRSAMAHVQLLKAVNIQVKGLPFSIRNLWAKVEIDRHTDTSTKIKAKLYASAAEPCFRCRLVRNIVHRKAQQEICQQVCGYLWTFERKSRIILASYKPKPKEGIVPWIIENGF